MDVANYFWFLGEKQCSQDKLFDHILIIESFLG
jgi:hypothetical protein